MLKTTYLYVFDTLSDWETGYLTAELNTNRFFRKGADTFEVKTVSNSMEKVKTMGGITILPDMTVKDMTDKDAALLILPGGETWLEPVHSEILDVADKFLAKGILVAAICGATAGLGISGILDSRIHTSNGLEFLKSVCPNYKGEALYKDEPAVIYKNLVTASGTAPLEMAHHVIKYLNLFTDDTLDAWYNLHKTSEGKYFYALMESMQKQMS